MKIRFGVYLPVADGTVALSDVAARGVELEGAIFVRDSEGRELLVALDPDREVLHPATLHVSMSKKCKTR